jgi:REP element-mobilizing transposase RayT/DNA-binding response OmpR family regulator
MSTPLLVITSDTPFGELIRQNLEETGRYVVRVSMEQEAAVAFARELRPPLAFLDTSLTEKELLKIGKLLRKASPEINFVIVSDTVWPTALEELSPCDYLSKPFYLPDLLGMMEALFRPAQVLEADPEIPADNHENVPTWLTDVNRAAQHLTRLTLESSAQAALITRKDELWAYAGQLPQIAAHELSIAVSRYWDRDEENDLVRFIRLESTDAEHMLYATRLAEGMVLALVFDAETPFSTIHTQASQLVHSLSTSPVDAYIKSDRMDRSSDPDGETQGGYERLDQRPLKESDSSILNRLTRNYSPTLMDPLTGTDPTGMQAETDIQEAPSRKKSSRRSETESVEEQAPRKIMLEPVSAAVYNLDYACLLVPRFPSHHLTGDLLEQLGEWVPHICIAFAWRLEYISVRPDYMQWIVSVPPATSPGYLMRMVRQHTSEKIFSDFPRFRNDNPSGDFWAPGYLIMGGSQPAPAQMIKDYIAQTRQRQGITLQYRQ